LILLYHLFVLSLAHLSFFKGHIFLKFFLLKNFLPFKQIQLS
jgi:hypothetical protein